MAYTEDTSKRQSLAGDLGNNVGFHTPATNLDNQSISLFTQNVLDKNALEAAPIRPEWILEGAPQAKCNRLATHTRAWGNMCHWSCTSGKFNWYYGWDESVVFVEGEVTITDENGKVYKGEPGVSLFFPAGTTAVWEVPKYIRKIAFNDKPVPKFLHIQSRLIERLQGLFRK
ncbi:hypothetical protein LP7551_03209 [Roseibium album]|nr:hypothetical protein LP7551_03209 [Roseibium album]